MKKVLIMMMCVIMVVCFMPTVAMATVGMGTVEGLTEGIEVLNNGTEVVTAQTAHPGTLIWYPKDTDEGRYQDGWWVGAKVTAPVDLSLSNEADVKYQSRAYYVGYESGATWSEEKSFYNNQDSPQDDANVNYMGIWVPVDPTSLNYGINIIYEYQFDWDRNGTYEQLVKVEIDPAKVILTKDDQQVYPVASIDGRNYATLSSAIAAADGKTVTLLKNTSENININAGTNVILDLNGKTLTGVINQYGSLTLKNGMLNNSGGQGINVYASGTDAENNNLTVADNAIIDASYAIILREAANGVNNYGTTIDVCGQLKGNLFVMGNIHTDLSTAQHPCVINVHDGAVIDSGVNNVGIALNGAAKLNVGKAAITSGTGIEVRAGELIVDGATIKGTATPTNVAPNGSGTTTDGAGIAIAQHTTKLPIKVTVNDGNISGYSALYESNPQNNSAADIAKVSIDVKGGNFSAISGGSLAVFSENKTGFISGGRFSTDVCARTYVADDKFCALESSAANAMYLVHDHNTTCNFGHTYCPATCKDANGAEMCHTSSHYVAPPTPTTPTDNVTNSGSTAADNATTSADLSGSTSTSNGTTSATVDKTIADKIVDKAVENKSTEVVIDATANTTTAADSTTIAQVTIPTETLGAIAEKTEADVTIKTDVAEVKMDNAAAAAVSEQAEGDTVQIIAEKVKEDATEVHFELKVVCSDGKVISDFKGGNVAVTVALPKAMADKKVVCVYIDDNGHMSKMVGQKNADGTYTFVTGHFSSYAILAEEEADAAIAAQKEAIKNIKIKLTSKQVKTKAGKKAVKITWTADAGDKVLDGVEVFRSKEKNKGYGTEPFYTSTKGGNTGSYTNTKSLKKGTKYYYRVRGYVLVNGEKVYTDYSTKAWRTVK